MRFFISLFLSLALGLTSCSQTLAPISQRRGGVLRSESDGSGTSAGTDPVSSGDESGDSEEVPSAIYVCGVEYPDTDSSQIVVLRDTTLMLALLPDIPKGIGLDPDTHFLYSDKLYTTASYGDKTIVALGGQPVFSFEGREYISDIIPTSRGLWTLGNDRSGEGFALRLDGKTVFKSGSGKGSYLHIDGGKTYCLYSSDDNQNPCLVEEGIYRDLSPRFGTRVLDARVVEGELWLLEQAEDAWIVSTSQERFDYPPRPPFQFRGARLYVRPDCRCSAVISLQAPGMGVPVELICTDGEEMLTGGGGGSCYHYFEGSQPYLLRYDRLRSHLSIGTAATEYACLDSTLISNRRAAQAWGSHFYAACYPAAGGEAILWSDGTVKGLGFDGYPTGVSVSPPK